ncbi:MAG: cysteine--tRNA ligase [Patescibacteria group bacterium]|nr:cysteine--tRNA ligase [Patescibacteria group bacterium]
MLKLFNTLSKQLEEFKPLEAGKVSMYTCGPTVYWNAHIGNFRAYVFEDVLVRLLDFEGFEVKRVLNITDVGHLTDDADEGEDKMVKAARREGKTVWDIADLYLKKFVEDSSKLNIRLPEKPYLCRATDHIEQQIELIKILMDKGFGYKTSDGIYFDTSKFQDYGKLSGQKSEDKEEGARVEANPEKRNKTDFALWKFSYQNGRSFDSAQDDSSKKRQMEWKSPWGVGFPGWHAECSAMAHEYLGQPFDIHCGGVDHIAVHHENEIAQSEAAYGTKMANYWLHNEFLTVDGQKMSKSIGNVYTLDELAEKGFEPLSLRLFYFGANYRQIQNFTFEALQASQNALHKLRNIARELEVDGTVLADVEADFLAALNDDLNTPKALAVVWKLLDSENSTQDKGATLLALDRVLALSLDGYVGKRVVVPDEIQALMDKRMQAREEKNWLDSDKLRAEIESRGWTIEDTKEGQRAVPKH